MLSSPARPASSHLRCWLPAFAVGLLVVLVAVEPTPLVPLAHAYAALCARYPVLALVTSHTPALPLALLLSLAGPALVIGSVSAITGILATLRFRRRLQRRASPPPLRLARIGTTLGLAERLTFLATSEPMACCYGLLRPRVAVTDGLIDRLDDTELAAVLAHERHHLRRRDPLRLLVLDALAAAAFMLPVAAILRQRCEAKIELAADRAAFAVAPRAALAGALLAVLGSGSARVPGVAALTVTEARIAHLAGRAALPPISLPAAMVSLGLVALVVLAAVDLGASTHLVEMLCPFCPWFA